MSIGSFSLRAWCSGGLSAAGILMAGWLAAEEPAKTAPPIETKEAKPEAKPTEKPEAKPAAPPRVRVAEPAAVAKEVDRLLAEEMKYDSAKLAAKADDGTFLRRVSLDIAGVNPTPAEIDKFLLDPDPAKRQKLVVAKLATAKYAENWAWYWRDVIMYRRSEDRAQIVNQALTTYLKDSLAANKGWDEIATAFITATGDVRTDGHTGLIMAQNGRPEETVAEISRIFLGIQIQCAQCHNHPTDAWQREQFHELAAFFPRVAVRPSQQQTADRTFLIEGTDNNRFGRGEFMGNRFRGTNEHRMPDLKNPSAPGKTMSPVFFVTGQKVSLGASDKERRGKLAEWITSEKDPWFAKAFVNRLWSELLGEGFHEPVDDLGPEREVSAPQTFDYLAAAWAKEKYDVKWLFETITATEAYQRASRPRRQENEPAFAAQINQRLRADQIYSNLTQAFGEAPQRFGFGGRGGGGGRFGFGGARFQFNAVFGYDPSTRRDEIASSIPQALMLMNGSQVTQAANSRGFAGLSKLLRDNPKNDDMTAALYLRILGREPTTSELTTVDNYIRSANDRALGYEDLAWALLNSTEFVHRP